MNVIKRNTHKEDILRYWNHNDFSNIGLGGGLMRRKINDQYLISKHCHIGRSDLLVFGAICKYTMEGDEYEEGYYQFVVESIEGNYLKSSLIGLPKKVQFEVLKKIKDWFIENKEEIKIQLHYLKWWIKVEFENVTPQFVIDLINTYVYNDEEAERLYERLKSDYTNIVL